MLTPKILHLIDSNNQHFCLLLPFKGTHVTSKLGEELYIIDVTNEK
jgi:hypothetical protein